jgi:hypothetical protein
LVVMGREELIFGFVLDEWAGRTRASHVRPLLRSRMTDYDNNVNDRSLSERCSGVAIVIARVCDKH